MPYKQPSEKAVEMIRFGIICQIYEPHKCRSTLEIHFEEHFPLYLRTICDYFFFFFLQPVNLYIYCMSGIFYLDYLFLKLMYLR